MTRLSAKNSKLTVKKISSKSLGPRPYSLTSTQDNIKFGSISNYTSSGLTLRIFNRENGTLPTGFSVRLTFDIF